ncbi:mannose-1-phosphate guanylyltransferase [Nocardioides sp. GY 10127]|uniref:mannose-1-phosphate guanylyltransferase n=1 Tax=Nocardioides sp. GY 10127 TaxID=2569762 RepID=UPI0010A78D02|nr:mannose-1-phosphate guanylyltransferase [Nocardioides sp. GY 10127]TIC84232.1 mannose-1-phosphate guanylyltransferase [Nocardioides sp. GY 10127]
MTLDDKGASSPLDSFYAVVPAGGAGTRLWPLSRARSPKFLRDLRGSGRSLLQETFDRLSPLCEDRFLVVTGTAHAEAVAGQLDKVPADAILTEPAARDSMAAIGFAAAVLERKDPDAVMGSFAADHVITDEAAFAQAVSTAVAVAREGWLVTLGIEPTFPSSAFGYIHAGAALEGHPGVNVVAEFVEKPSTETATEYLATGEFRWNAGMFVARPSTILDLLHTWHPEFADRLRELAADPSLVEAAWADLPKIALDHAIAEPAAAAGKVATVPAAFGWDDIGDFDSLATLLGGEESTSTVVLGEPELVQAIDTTGLVVPHEKLIAVVGLDDVVVVDTPDALLVTTRARAQDVKKLVNALKDGGLGDLT